MLNIISFIKFPSQGLHNLQDITTTKSLSIFFFPIFRFLEFGGDKDCFLLLMFQNAKEHQAEKSQEATFNKDRACDLDLKKNKKGCFTSPSLLSSLYNMLQSCFPAEKLLGAKLQQVTEM